MKALELGCLRTDVLRALALDVVPSSQLIRYSCPYFLRKTVVAAVTSRSELRDASDAL